MHKQWHRFPPHALLSFIYFVKSGTRAKAIQFKEQALCSPDHVSPSLSQEHGGQSTAHL